MQSMMELLEVSPVVVAIKDEKGLTRALESDCHVIFILYGTICNIGAITEKIADAGKVPIVHADLINGLSMKDVAIDFIRDNTKAQGIISTKPMLVKRAKELGLLAVQRSFIIDSMALDNMKKQLEAFEPDAIEIMPGVMPRIIRQIRSQTKTAIIAGGLLTDKKDVMAALEAGADAVSTTSVPLWSV